MRQTMVVKIVFLAALAVAALATTEISFDDTPLDGRASDKIPARQNPGMELPAKTRLSDAELLQTHSRPLFSQNRRPFVARLPVVEQPVAAVEEPVADPPSSLPRRLVLLGTDVGGSPASVLVRNQDNAEVRWLKVGETFDGWTLSETAADEASFVCPGQQGDDCRYRLTLYSEPGGL